VFAGESDFGNVEAKSVCGRVAEILHILDHLRDVTAPDRAVAGTGEEKNGRGR
jgi:hypothetical protein